MAGKPLLDLPDALALIGHETPSERAFAATLVRSIGIGMVRQAENGSEALWLLKQESFSVAVVDWNLGGMDVRAFIHAVRRLDAPSKRALPVVLLSTVAQRPAIDAAMAAGAASYIVKPVAPAVLAKRLKAAIAVSRDFIETPTYTGPCRRRAPKPDYTGPWRRAADKAVLVELDEPGLDPRAQLRRRARIHLDGLLLRLARIEDGHPDSVHQFEREVQNVRAVAGELQDGLLDRGAAILMKYVAGETKYFDEARAHLDALRHLTAAHALDPLQREAVGAELQRMAEKTMQRLRDRARNEKASPAKA